MYGFVLILPSLLKGRLTIPLLPQSIPVFRARRGARLLGYPVCEGVKGWVSIGLWATGEKGGQFELNVVVSCRRRSPPLPPMPVAHLAILSDRVERRGGFMLAHAWASIALRAFFSIVRTAGSSIVRSRTGRGDKGDASGDVCERPGRSDATGGPTIVVRLDAEGVPVNGTKVSAGSEGDDAGKFGLYDMRGRDLLREKAPPLPDIDPCIMQPNSICVHRAYLSYSASSAAATHCYPPQALLATCYSSRYE